MNMKLIMIIAAALIPVLIQDGFSASSHEFLTTECSMCHVDEKNDPFNLIPSVNDSCLYCHPNIDPAESHPTNAFPQRARSMPDDLPLFQGKVVCITCHFTHPQPEKKHYSRHDFLRKNPEGTFFCTSCHERDKRDHITMGKAHMISYATEASRHSLDRISVFCIECHDSKMSDGTMSLTAIRWVCRSRLNHPVGVLVNSRNTEHKEQLRPAVLLSREIKLFSGKIGCGTCHNIFSKNKKLLVVDNRNSRLCLECHMK